MSKCFWSYNYRLITAVQQHENLQLIGCIASRPTVTACCHPFNPVCPHQQSTVAKYPFDRSRGGRRRTEDFSSNGCITLNLSLTVCHFNTRPRPRLVKTGHETSRDQDSSLENSKSAAGKPTNREKLGNGKFGSLYG